MASPIHPTDRRARARRRAAGYVIALVVVALTTLATRMLGLAWLADADVVLAYLVAITIVAVRFGIGPAILAAAASVALFDWFFIPPFYTFTVESSRHLVTFAMMFVVGIFVSGVATRLQRHEADAVERERRTHALLALTRATAAAGDADEVATSLATHARAAFEREADVVLGDAPPPTSPPAAGDLVVPLISQSRAEGTLVLRQPTGAPPEPLAPHERELADAFARQAATALERLRLADDARATALRRRTEELRAALLSAVSHDLRTPLATITGGATTLLQDDAPPSEGDRRLLLEAIAAQAFHLERLVTSLLDMTRVEGGVLTLRREWIPVEELIGSAAAATRALLAPRQVRTDIALDLPMLHVDPALFEQVVVNLLENAARHTPPSAAVTVAASVGSDGLVLAVSDDGPGLPADIDVFEKFVRGPGSRAGGLGLGLAICRGIVEAHGGRIVADRAARGARFVITLPVPPPPPTEAA